MNLFTLVAKLILDDSEYVAGVDSASKKGLNFAHNLKTGLGTAVKAATAMIGAASTAVVGLGKLAFDYNSEIEGYTSNFTVMLGDAKLAAEKVEELKKMGASTPFELGDLAKATTTLMAFNVSSDKSTGILQKLGDISLGNAQKLETLTRAYGKMNASQKVSLEDINMMIDSGFNPLLLVAEKTGESMEDLYGRISKGGVAFEEIQDAIDQATSAGGQYYKGMETASKTTQGLISTLKDNARALVGEVFLPVSEGMTQKVLPSAITAIDTLTQAFHERGVAGMVDAAGEMVGSAAGELSQKAPGLIENGIELVHSLTHGVRENLPEIVEGAGDTFFAFTGGISALLPELLGTGTDIVLNLGQYIIDNPDKVIEGAGSIFGSFVSSIAESLPKLGETAGKIVGSLGSYLSEHSGEILGDALELGGKLAKGVYDGAMAFIKNSFWGITDAMSSYFSVSHVPGVGPKPGSAEAERNKDAIGAAADAHNQTNITNNITVNESSNPRGTAKEVSREINRNAEREMALN